jgi:putative ABC transport system permease protein
LPGARNEIMNILSIPLRYMLRKWPKTLLLFGVFTLGAASVVALDHVSSRVAANMERQLAAFGANILVRPRTDTLRVGYGGVSLGAMQFGARHLDEAAVERAAATIADRANIATVAPKLLALAMVRGAGGSPVNVGLVGVRWDRERRIKSHWRVDGAYPDEAAGPAGPARPAKLADPDAPRGVVAGARAAAALGVAPGGVVRIAGQDLRVAGVLRPTGGDDDSVLLADLDFVQRAFGLEGKASFVEVAALCSGCPIDEIAAQLAAALPGAEVGALQGVVRQRMHSIGFVQKLLLGVSLVILLTACAMVGLSMLAAVNERVREIGLLRSLGFSRGAVFVIFCFEAACIGLAAGLAGYALGTLAGGEALGLIDVARGAAGEFDGVRLAATAGLMGLLATLAAFAPAWKAARTEPSRALTAL